MAKESYDALSVLDAVGEQAKGRSTTAEKPKSKGCEDKPMKTVRSMRVPTELIERHADLKAAGKTTQNFSGYTFEALRRALDEDQ